MRWRGQGNCPDVMMLGSVDNPRLGASFFVHEDCLRLEINFCPPERVKLTGTHSRVRDASA